MGTLNPLHTCEFFFTNACECPIFGGFVKLSRMHTNYILLRLIYKWFPIALRISTITFRLTKNTYDVFAVNFTNAYEFKKKKYVLVEIFMLVIEKLHLIDLS